MKSLKTFDRRIYYGGAVSMLPLINNIKSQPYKILHQADFMVQHPTTNNNITPNCNSLNVIDESEAQSIQEELILKPLIQLRDLQTVMDKSIERESFFINEDHFKDSVIDVSLINDNFRLKKQKNEFMQLIYLLEDQKKDLSQLTSMISYLDQECENNRKKVKYLRQNLNQINW
ncbi:hypothetical protein SS50377_20890 [Spironucleus salmonicida]|uniref:Uncharacterized protein n=1 Tax=Spironucleus salmonicida TaxID=348837 RepID=V6LIM2_9EUKA|nr:hypothetical protein SS50377_20890 [Spironucleus salmonicida]|eukprot:EST43566.1 Hypothetical protein SS50377_16605 [Spironucleus salmonicida]